MTTDPTQPTEYDQKHQRDFDAAIAAFHPLAIAMNRAPYAVYMSDERRQAWLCGWAAAAVRDSEVG